VHAIDFAFVFFERGFEIFRLSSPRHRQRAQNFLLRVIDVLKGFVKQFLSGIAPLLELRDIWQPDAGILVP
jgi:hypothetical protein